MVVKSFGSAHCVIKIYGESKCDNEKNIEW